MLVTLLVLNACIRTLLTVGTLTHSLGNEPRSSTNLVRSLNGILTAAYFNVVYGRGVIAENY